MRRLLNAGRYVVTGGSSGIGAAIVQRLVDEDCSVVSIARRASAIDSPLVESVECDLSDLDAIEQKLKPLKAMEDLAGVVLCHGYGDFGGLEQFSSERIVRLVNTNLTSNILIARLLLPLMKARGSGALIVLGSEAALRGGQQGAVYSATKFGLRGLAQSLRQECSGAGIRVTIVNPGMVDTPFFETLDFAPGENVENALSAQDVAEAVLNVLRVPPHMVLDEINLSPLKTVVRHTKRVKI